MFWSAVVLVTVAACNMFGLDPPSLAGDAGSGSAGSGAGSGSGSDNAGSGSGTSAAPLAFMQFGCNANWNPGTSLAATFPDSERAGDLAVIAVSWTAPGSIASVTDSAGNAWTPIATPITNSGKSLALYYSPSVREGANTVTVAFSASVSQSWLKALEYSGVAHANPLDITTAQSGTGTSVTSGMGQTMHAHDLIVGAATFQSDITSMGAGYTERVRCFGDLVQDQVVDQRGGFAATATLTQSATWNMRMVAFVAQ